MPATGEGALGFCKALAQVFLAAREQRSWVQKTANELDNLPKRLPPGGERKDSHHLAATRADAALNVADSEIGVPPAHPGSYCPIPGCAGGIIVWTQMASASPLVSSENL
jgi:hypothetical protein